MNIARQFLPHHFEQNTASEPNHLGSVSLINIRDFFGRQWRLIAVITGLCVVVGAIYVALSPTKYTAQADMLIDTKKVTWTQSDMSTENRNVDDASVESEIETTKSEKVAMAVINRLRLTDSPEFVGSGGGMLHRLFSIAKIGTSIEPAASKDDLMRSALGVFKSNLRVTRLGRSYIEQISYTSLDRDKAATIANAVADAYVEDQLQAKYDATRRASAWLEQRIGELRQQASDAYKAVQDFKSANSIIISADGKLASEVELDQLGTALAKARSDTTQAKAKLDRIQRVLEQRSVNNESLNIPDPVVTDALSNPVITKLRQQFLDDQNRESEWSSRYGADHQAARNLRAEMAALQRAIWDEISRIAESYKSELQIAKSQEESIDKRMLEVFQQSSTTRQSQVRLRELETAANTYRGIYETFLSRFTQSVQQQSFPSTEARLVTLATAPRAPSAPKIGLILALSALAGIGFGMMAAFAREQMNRQVHTRSQIEDLLGKSCLAVLPALKKIKSANRLGPTKDSGAFRQINQAAPFSSTAEALRYIKVAIDLHPADMKIVGMVSALPGEGKTTVAASFAAFLAKSGSKTLLIDADLRNPSLTRGLGYQDEPGLLNLVAERVDFRDLVISDPKYMFDFFPASTRIKPANSSDILTSAAMKDMLKAASAEYEYIIVDLPPILPIVDVKASAHLFDGFVLVVEWGGTSTDEIVKAVSASAVVSDRLLGTVLNKADEAVMRRFEGYSDRRYSYYTDEDTTEAA
jgi:succinoglycan biosynthesis transport protein ExoP